MATVRMSQRHIAKMVDNAASKFEKQNQKKEFPATAGDTFVSEYDLVGKAQATQKHLEETWGSFDNFDTTTMRVSAIDLRSTLDDDDYHTTTFTLPLTSNIHLPSCFSRTYGTFSISVKPDNPTFVKCYEIDQHNKRVKNELYAFKRDLRETLEQFTTLNQALKASDNAYSGIVPHASMQRVMEKDDRKKREQELAEIAQKDISTLQEVLLTDSLLGDD